MSPETDFAVGDWIHFGDYKVIDGSIRPIVLSGVQPYTPWQMFVDSLDPESLDSGEVAADSSLDLTRKRRLPDAPYQALLALVSEIEREDGTDGVGTEVLVCQWCSEHGLLGLLPHRTHAAFLVPRYEWTSIDERVDLAPVQRVHSWARGVWTTEIRVALDEVISDADVSRPGGELVSADALPHGWTSPVAVFSPLDELRPEPVPLEKAWGRFFPEANGQADYPYPSPAGLRFWRSYAEPLDEFLAAARLFSGAVRGIAEAQHDEDREALGRHVRILETLAAAASPHLRRSEASAGGLELTQYWVTPSLLSSYVLMALFDVAGGRRLRVCADPKCRMPFRSSAYQSAYCSERHRSRHTVARHRERKAQAQRLFEDGLGAEEIVAELPAFRSGELTSETVLGWAREGGWTRHSSSDTHT